MFSPNKGTGRSKLPKGQACIQCRRRKIRCDGKNPNCSPCLKNKLECKYDNTETSEKQTSRRRATSASTRGEGSRSGSSPPLASSSTRASSAVPPRSDPSLTGFPAFTIPSQPLRPSSSSSITQPFMSMTDTQMNNSFETSFMRGTHHRTSSLPQSVMPNFSSTSTNFPPPPSFGGFGNLGLTQQNQSSGAPFSFSNANLQRRTSTTNEIRNLSGSPLLPVRTSPSSFGTNGATLPPILDPASTSQRERYPQNLPENGNLNTLNPSLDVVTRLVGLFFAHSSVNNVLQQEPYLLTLDQILKTGSQVQKALLHSVLAISVAFGSLEDARESLDLFQSSTFRQDLPSKKAIASIHAARARELVEPFRFDSDQTEDILPISLCLTSYEMGQADQELVKEMSWSNWAIRKMGFHDLPLMPSTNSTAWTHVPSICDSEKTFWQWLQRRDRFWAWYSMDRALQVSMAWPCLLQDEDVLTTLPCHEDRLESGSTRARELHRVNSHPLEDHQGDSDDSILLKCAILLSKSVTYRLRSSASDELNRAANNASMTSEFLHLSQRVRSLQLVCQAQVPTGTTLADPIKFASRVLTLATVIVLNESLASYTEMDSATTLIVATAQEISNLASELASNPLNFLYCRSETVTCWFMAAKVLVRRASSSTSPRVKLLLESDFQVLLNALIRNGHWFPRGTSLAKCLLALQEAHPAVYFPVHWPPFAKMEDPKTSKSVSLLELSEGISDDILERMVL